MGLAPKHRLQITLKEYEASHMMYIHVPSLLKLKADISAFIDNAIPATN